MPNISDRSILNRDKIKNILIVRNDRFGEFLLNIPALRALKETFTKAKIMAIVSPYAKELAECVPYIDEIIEWGDEKHGLLERLTLVNTLKKKQIDLAVMLNPSREFNFISFLSKIPLRVGYDHKCPFLLTHRLKDIKSLGLRHEVEYNLELVGLVGARTDDKSLILKIEEKMANNLFKGPDLGDKNKLILVHPFTSDQVKQWEPAKFRELIKRSAQELNLKIVIIGSIQERDESLELYGNLGVNVVNMVGRTSLKQLAVLLRKSRLLISGDSGPVHLACSVGTPVIAIFKNDPPGKGPTRWGPWGENNTVIQKNSLSDISVNEAIEALKLRLNEKNSCH